MDEDIIGFMKAAGIDFVSGVPCGLLAGVFERVQKERDITFVLATREEEAVGICAGAYLGGKKPALLLQNSGLGNSMNALLSLTRYYGLGLLLVAAYRGRRAEEKIEAQRAMGEATLPLLAIAGATVTTVENAEEIGGAEADVRRAMEQGGIAAVLLTPRLWKSD